MTDRVARNRQFQHDLFAGPFPGHALVFDAPGVAHDLGDYTLSERPVSDWVPWVVANYQARVDQLAALDDDSVPVAVIHTHTGVFAEAFGCRLHAFEGSNAAALPFIHTAAEAAALRLPDFAAGRSLARFWELAELVREELGPDVPVTGPDIQSPFDIAALIWNKEELFLAMLDEPEAVLELVDKTHALLTNFLDAFRAEFPCHNTIHCPTGAFAPPSLGCSLSEDEVGSLSPAMFEQFCLPSLTALSERYGGLFMHCCAAADVHYPGFKRVPNLRGLNRVFQPKYGPQPAIDAFGAVVHMVAWTGEDGVRRLLELARPETRFLFNMGALPLEQARRSHERLRSWCGRV